MNRSILKYIAIIAMTLDHIAVFLISSPLLYFIFRLIGRITFPIMLFFIIEGYKHTSNKFNYGKRMLIFALISQIPYTLLFSKTLLTWNLLSNLNIMFTLFFTYLFICTLNSNTKLWIKILLLLAILIPIFFCEYNIIAIVYALLFYYGKNNVRIMLLPLVYIISSYMNILTNNITGYDVIYTILINLGIFLVSPLLILYNHKPGNKSVLNKYSYYVYYPLHLLIIFIITLL